MMHILEQFTCGKSPIHPSEDRIIATPHFCGVVDGATPKVHIDEGEETPGFTAARLIATTIELLPATCQAFDAIQVLTEALDAQWKQQLKAKGGADANAEALRPTASLVLYSEERHEVWQVGDCPFLLGSQEVRNEKHIDAILAQWRSRKLHQCLLSKQLLAGQILQHDPGRACIQPFITAQVKWQNANPKLRHAFGVLDGHPVSKEFIKCYPIPQNVHEVVLASDGYPRLWPTWQATETYLQRLLSIDPWCINELCGTKGVLPGNTSFDDRSYIRIQVH